MVGFLGKWLYLVEYYVSPLQVTPVVFKARSFQSILGPFKIARVLILGSVTVLCIGTEVPVGIESMAMRVTKAIIAAAGLGTRLLPATKGLPKELFPIVDRPVLHYIVEEVIASGIREIIVVTRHANSPIEAYFRNVNEEGSRLDQRLDPSSPRDSVGTLWAQADVVFLPQPSELPYGNGSPLLAARELLDRDEPFAYLFGDDLVLSQTPCLRQLLDVFTQHAPAAVIAFQEVASCDTGQYGIAKLRAGSDPPEMESIVEKPVPANAPSRFAQLGRFVFTPQVLDILESISVVPGQELYLTHAVDVLCQQARVIMHPIEGRWFTVGDPLRFLMANVAYGLVQPELRAEFAAFLQRQLSSE